MVRLLQTARDGNVAMILVIGGLNGFIGSNTTEALVDLGQNCVVTRHENTDVPSFLQKHIDHRHVFIKPANSTSVADLRKIGQKHKIDGIVNVAGGFASGEGPLRGLKGYFDMLDATFQVAQEWKVKRVTFSSTGGMYLGLSGTVDEEHPIALQSKFPILAYQKIVEVAADQFAKKTGISAICVRLMGMFGPFDGAQLGLPARLVHAAVSGRPPSFEDVFFGNAEDRKSTRLNSSHGYISYAVFCLKKKTNLLTGSPQREPAPAGIGIVTRVRTRWATWTRGGPLADERESLRWQCLPRSGHASPVPV